MCKADRKREIKEENRRRRIIELQNLQEKAKLPRDKEEAKEFSNKLWFLKQSLEQSLGK